MNKSTLLSPIKYVVEKSEHVRIDEGRIRDFAKNYVEVEADHWLKACPFEYEEFDDVRDEIDYRFLADSMAFCFWGFPYKWRVEYQNMELDGWWAMLACLKRAYAKGVPIFEGKWMASLTFDEVRELFEGKPEIPLLRERWRILTEIGEVLEERYEGRFSNFLNLKRMNALELLLAIVAEFPSFDDVYEYKGKQVRFYKKAQLLVNDLAKVEGISEIAEISGLEELTGKADYKIPALLRKLGILEYSSDLAKIVDNRIEIESGSEMEVEIRANMIWATELMCKELADRGIMINPIELDNVLWVMSQKKAIDDKPYHLTLTVDY